MDVFQRRLSRNQSWCGILHLPVSRLFLSMDHFRLFSLAVVVSSFSVFLYISGGSLLYFHDMFHFRGLVCDLLVVCGQGICHCEKKEVIFFYYYFPPLFYFPS
ncbi:hypothetical protein BDV26DRAFT_32269 [Aspergillus bertholletiae]|uniref:Transmembrane protein n=1 Tax=Aspergillus bertholletiae TaxID=1226010 RepID=A0A5N7AYJ2_9EURO|nr:hypothetical protein BDV26DRAFT_32269 [Aspergillus bertholletiae]